MDDNKILDIISQNLKISDKYIIIRDKSNNIIFPKDLDLIKDIERLMKNNDRDFYDKKTGNHYTRKTTIFYNNEKEYIFDLIENNNRFKKIEERSKIDAATNLLNKNSIMNILDEFILNKNKDIISLGIVVCDIDKFKSINDNYGHLAGDEIIKIVADNLNSLSNNNCLVGRFGGDEFILIYKNINSDTIYQKIEKMRKNINSLNINFENSIIQNITMSFGIYVINDFSGSEITNLNNIIEKRRNMFYQADEALYQSKKNGKNKVTLIEANENEKSYIINEANNINDYILNLNNKKE